MSQLSLHQPRELLMKCDRIRISADSFNITDKMASNAPKMLLPDPMIRWALDACEGSSRASKLTSIGLHRAMGNISPISQAETDRILSCGVEEIVPTSNFAKRNTDLKTIALPINEVKALLSLEAPTPYKGCHSPAQAAATMLPFEDGKLEVEYIVRCVLSILENKGGPLENEIRYDVERVVSETFDPDKTGYVSIESLEKAFVQCESYSPISKVSDYVETKGEDAMMVEALREDVLLQIPIPDELLKRTNTE